MIAILLAAGALALPAQPTPAAASPACKGPATLQTAYPAPALLLRPQDRATIRPLKLGELPKANKEIAVARAIDGCAVPVGISFQVEGDGRFATEGR